MKRLTEELSLKVSVYPNQKNKHMIPTVTAGFLLSIQHEQ